MWAAGLQYSVLVFGAGFVLGIVRVLWLAPLVGARTAELLEMPAMLAVIYFAADWTVRRVGLPRIARLRLGMGLFAVVLLLVAEFAVVLPVRGLSLHEYFQSRDPLTATAYYFSLVVMAGMPVFVSRH